MNTCLGPLDLGFVAFPSLLSAGQQNQQYTSGGLIWDAESESKQAEQSKMMTRYNAVEIHNKAVN